MASVDMCEHDWPGSGCKECRADRERAKLPTIQSDIHLLFSRIVDPTVEEIAIRDALLLQIDRLQDIEFRYDSVSK